MHMRSAKNLQKLVYDSCIRERRCNSFSVCVMLLCNQAKTDVCRAPYDDLTLNINTCTRGSSGRLW